MMNMIAKERLFLTADSKRLVREGDDAAATLYVAPGDEIPSSAVELFGLKDGTIGDKSGGGTGVVADAGTKEKAPTPTKEKAPSPNKEKQPGETKGGAGDDLTQVRGIGASSAKAFAAAGITSFAQIAAIDPASPPTVEGLGARPNWAGFVESAKALLPPAGEQGDGGASGDSGGAGGGAGQAGA